jgi:hypothetical protein
MYVVIRWTLSLLFVLLVSACAPQDPRHQGDGRVQLSPHPFSLVPPAGWPESDQGEATRGFAGPEGDGLAASLVMRAAPGQATVAEMAEQFAAQSTPAGDPTADPTGDIREQRVIQVDGKEALWILGESRVEGRAVRSVQLFMPAASDVYMVSFMAGAEAFERHRPELDGVVESIRWD